MSAATSADASPGVGPSPSPTVMRFGHESSGAAGEWAVEWSLKRNCSLAPRQLLVWCSALCAVALAVASCFWWIGARMVMPFAWLEVLAVGAALLCYARHAADAERLVLCGDRLTVEHASGSRLERVQFRPGWVRVESAAGGDALVELSGDGRRIAVGRYLRPELRRQLADELRMALRRSATGDPGQDGAGAADGI